jgi:hypothetical protein
MQIDSVGIDLGKTTFHLVALGTAGKVLASPAMVGIETVGNDQWFVQLLQKLGHEVCVGDAAQIRASYITVK